MSPQPAWKIVFDSLWKTFNLRFQGILENLKKHRDLIDTEANAINIAEAKAWRKTQMDHIKQWRADRAYEIDKIERERLASQTREAVAWIGASEGQEDIFAKFSKACDGSQGHWILKDSTIVSWLGQGGRDESVIWLNGKPGAGKSCLSFAYPSDLHVAVELVNILLKPGFIHIILLSAVLR